MEARPLVRTVAVLLTLLPSCGNEVVQVSTTSSSADSASATSTVATTSATTSTTSSSSSTSSSSTTGAGGQTGCTTPDACPDPGALCQIAVCDQGQCGVAAAPLDTPCSAVGGGKVCADPDGPKAGKCVECNDVSAGMQCASKICVGNTCIQSTCTDGVQNGAETDIDCGGPDCAACPNGGDCVVAADCVSGKCAASGCESPCSPPGIVPSAIPGCQNITGLASASASGELDPAAWAIDQNICSAWNVGHLPPADITLFLGPPRAVRGITLVPDMAPDGSVTHVVETSMDGVNFTTALTINQFMASHVAYPFDLGAPVMTKYVRVRTTSSPAWVAWFEIALFECP